MIRRPVIILIPLVVLTFASQASGSCFSVFENGVRAAGMGGAFVSIANDGSAIFYNPAGIAFQKGTRMEMNSLVVVGLFRFKPTSTPQGTIVPEKGYNLNTSPHFIPIMSMYLTKEISPRLTAGFGMYAPFGLAANATNFKDSDPKVTKYVGRYAGTRGMLQSFWLQPTVAYRLSKNSSFAAGVAWVHTHLLIEESILNPLDDGKVFGEQVASKVFAGMDKTLSGAAIARMLPEGRARFAGTSDRPGYSAGYLYKHEKSGTNIGLMWRSAVTHKLSGKASFAFTTGYALENFVGKDTIPKLFPAQPIKASFTTPATYSIGVSNSALLKGVLALQVDVQDYKRFKDVPLNFSNTTDTATPAELRLTFAMQTSYVVRAGYERPLGDKNTVRIGYFFDHTPVTDKSTGPLFPDSSRNNITFGVSRVRNNAELSFFYQAMFMRDRLTNVPENDKVFTNGLYLNFVHLFGFSMRMRMGATTNPFDR
jgi:long-chain fatty acid transport protein